MKKILSSFGSKFKELYKKRLFKICFWLFIIGIIFVVSACLYFAYFIEQKIPVITYHNIVTDEEYENYKNDFFATKISTFEKQMKFLKDNNFKTLSLEEYECWKKGTCKQPRKSVLITFDDGWSSVYKYALPVLKENGQKAVSFVLYYNVEHSAEINPISNPLSYLTLDMIKDSEKEYDGLEYASHSYKMHDSERHGKRSKEEIQEDIDSVKKYNNSTYYAYPNGYSNKMYEELLKENGYTLAFGFGPYANSSKKDNDYHISRTVAGDAVPYWKFVIKMLVRY